MKQSLKYGFLLVLSLLFNTAVNQAMGNYCKEKTPANGLESSNVSISNPIHNALEHLFYYYSTQSSDLSHLDIAPIPTDKSTILSESYFCRPKNTRCIPHGDFSHIPKYLADPISYYIYGLRKIVI